MSIDLDRSKKTASYDALATPRARDSNDQVKALRRRIAELELRLSIYEEPEG